MGCVLAQISVNDNSKVLLLDAILHLTLFFHITQGYRTLPHGIQHNNNHGYAWTRGV